MSTFTDPAAAGKLICAPACQDQEAPFRAEPQVEGDGWWRSQAPPTPPKHGKPQTWRPEHESPMSC